MKENMQPEEVDEMKDGRRESITYVERDEGRLFGIRKRGGDRNENILEIEILTITFGRI